MIALFRDMLGAFTVEGIVSIVRIEADRWEVSFEDRTIEIYDGGLEEVQTV